ncbi:alpha/beta hydrolase [Rhizobium sp. ACO-34A]|nr:alpha/beta hydrolase [Rhizobium sp. ACO-34A]ATN34687.1 alpha/beta hydrolase [Rhizobium sp. ACO-34A]
MPSFAIKVTRAGFSVLERVSPDIAARLAFLLFCVTPSKKPKGDKAKVVFAAGAQRLSAAEKVTLPISSGFVSAYRLASREAAPRRVLVVHGWGARAEYLTDIASGLQASGAEVVLLDLPGHGRSSGRLLDMRRAAEAIVAAQAQFGPFDGAVGHSFGGASLMTASGGIFGCIPAFRAGRMVLIGSPSRITDVMRDFADLVGLGSVVRERLAAYSETMTGAPVEAYDAVPIARRIDRSLLVIHAEDDKEVRAEHARRYLGISEKVQHFWANGYGHRRIVSAPEVIAATSRFLCGSEASLSVVETSPEPLREVSSI